VIALVHSPEELKTLLVEAEKKLVEAQEQNQNLAQDNVHLNTAINDMMVAQMEEAEQIVQLTERCWELESALEDALSEKDEALELVHGLGTGLKGLKSKADEALARARTETSRVVLASELHNLASKTIDTELDQYLDKLSKPIKTR